MADATTTAPARGARLRDHLRGGDPPASSRRSSGTGRRCSTRASRRSRSAWAWARPRRTARPSTRPWSSSRSSRASARAITRARKSIAQFKLREGMAIGCKVTLRGNRMWEFLDRLTSVALPRIRDFRGINPDGFDGRGNYNLGLREQTIFPEIDYDRVDAVRGLNVTITTTAGDRRGGPGPPAPPRDAVPRRGLHGRGAGRTPAAQAEEVRPRSRPAGRGETWQRPAFG